MKERQAESKEGKRVAERETDRKGSPLCVGGGGGDRAGTGCGRRKAVPFSSKGEC